MSGNVKQGYNQGRRRAIISNYTRTLLKRKGNPLISGNSGNRPVPRSQSPLSTQAQSKTNTIATHTKAGRMLSPSLSTRPSDGLFFNSHPTSSPIWSTTATATTTTTATTSSPSSSSSPLPLSLSSPFSTTSSFPDLLGSTSFASSSPASMTSNNTNVLLRKPELLSTSTGTRPGTYTNNNHVVHRVQARQQQSQAQPSQANQPSQPSDSGNGSGNGSGSDNHTPPPVEASSSTKSDDSLEERLNILNAQAEPLLSDPLSVISWARDEFQGRVAMSTSMGIQAAVLLHMATQIIPDIPVVWVDTGYLPSETYTYAEDLKEALGLNLIVVSNTEWTPARMEAVYGKLWEHDSAEAHTLYGRMRKVVPMNAGLDSIEPNPLALFSGLRAGQTKARASMKPVEFQRGRYKVLPMLRMTDDDVETYFDRNDLPRHPLQAKGYITVGDYHSSRPVEEGEDGRSTRFGGKFEECGLHVDEADPEPTPAPPSSALAGDHAATATSTTSESYGVPKFSPTPPPPSHSAGHSGHPASSVSIQPDSHKPPASNKPKPQKPASSSLSPPMASAIPKKGLEALGYVKPHPSTKTAVIMVKKVMEDGSSCRKCQDVLEKMENDDIKDWVGHIAVADVLQPESEGAIMAREFHVATAPFFLVRTEEEEQQNKPWRAVRSYLQLRKILQAAHEQVMEGDMHAMSDKDVEIEAKKRHAEELRAQIHILQNQLRIQEESLREEGADPSR